MQWTYASTNVRTGHKTKLPTLLPCPQLRLGRHTFWPEQGCRDICQPLSTEPGALNSWGSSLYSLNVHWAFSWETRDWTE